MVPEQPPCWWHSNHWKNSDVFPHPTAQRSPPTATRKGVMSEPRSPLPQEAAQPSADEARRRRSAVLIVFLVVFIDLLGFGIVLPLLPRFGEMYIDQLIPGGHSGSADVVVLPHALRSPSCACWSCRSRARYPTASADVRSCSWGWAAR